MYRSWNSGTLQLSFLEKLVIQCFAGLFRYFIFFLTVIPNYVGDIFFAVCERLGGVRSTGVCVVGAAAKRGPGGPRNRSVTILRLEEIFCVYATASQCQYFLAPLFAFRSSPTRIFGCICLVQRGPRKRSECKRSGLCSGLMVRRQVCRGLSQYRDQYRNHRQVRME